MISLILILLSVYMKCSFLKKSDERDDDDMNAIMEAFKQTEKLYKNKQTKLLSDIYDKVNPLEVATSTANMLSAREGKKNFTKLNAIANNVYEGDKKLKDNYLVKGALTVMLNNPQLQMDSRIQAAKLATRLTNLPTTIQMTSLDPNKKLEDANTHIIMPRLKRIYRPDYYIENYKAGNWNI